MNTGSRRKLTAQEVSDLRAIAAGGMLLVVQRGSRTRRMPCRILIDREYIVDAGHGRYSVTALGEEYLASINEDQ
jgi:hypothetical protein